VSKPEAFLGLLLGRSWSDNAYAPALQRLFQTRCTPGCQPFCIYVTTKAFLQAAPVGCFSNPASLRPAIERAFQPIAGPADQMVPLIEAAGLLLAACPGPWEPSLLSTAIHNNMTAKPPPHSTDAEQATFYESQTMLLKLLRIHCSAPPASGDNNLTSYQRSYIGTALAAGVEPGLLQELLARFAHATLWHPGGLCKINAQGELVPFDWPAETSNFKNLCPVIVAAAVTHGATEALETALLYIAHPFQHGNDREWAENNYTPRLERMMELLQAMGDRVCSLSANNLLPVLQKAAHTRNVKLLQGLVLASDKFCWPAADLVPLLENVAAGTRECEVNAVMMLVLLVDGKPGYSPAQIAQVAAAAVHQRLPLAMMTPPAADRLRRMLRHLCAECSMTSVAAAASALGMPGVAAVLDIVSSTGTGYAATGVGAAAAEPSEQPVQQGTATSKRVRFADAAVAGMVPAVDDGAAAADTAEADGSAAAAAEVGAPCRPSVSVASYYFSLKRFYSAPGTLGDVLANLKQQGGLALGRGGAKVAVDGVRPFILSCSVPVMLHVQAAAAGGSRSTAAAAAAAAAVGDVTTQCTFSEREMLAKNSRGEDLAFIQNLTTFDVSVEMKAKKDPAKDAEEHAAGAHRAKLLAVAVVLRQLCGMGGAQEPDWASAGLQEVLAHAQANEATLSNSSVLVANFGGRLTTKAAAY
jgi:hypothetical protein